MPTFPIKVHYNYGDRNVGSEIALYEANADFQRDYYKRRKLAGWSPGNDDEVSTMRPRVLKAATATKTDRELEGSWGNRIHTNISPKAASEKVQTVRVGSKFEV